MLPAMRMLTFFFTLVPLRLIGSSLLIRKCCLDGEHLFFDEDMFCFNPKPRPVRDSNVTQKLVREVITSENAKFPLWMDPYMPPLSPTTLSPVPAFLGNQDNGTYVEYGVHLTCDLKEMVVVHSTDSEHSILHNGSLIFRAYGGHNVTFAPDSYCADLAVNPDFGNSYVYLLCPCVNNTCLKSCCGADEFLFTEWRIDECVKLEADLSSHALQSKFSLRGYNRNIGTYECSVDKNDNLVDYSRSLSWTTYHERHIISLRNSFTSPNSTRDIDCHNVRPSGNKGNREYVHEICIKTNPFEQKSDEFYRSINACSAAVLTLTLLIFVIVGEMQKSKSRIITSHILCVLIAEVCSAWLRNTNWSVNNVFYYSTYFPVAATLWINVLCIDLASSFRTFRVQNPGARRSTNRKFLYYNIYVWGVTTVNQLICSIFFHGDRFGVEDVVQNVFIPLSLGIFNSLLLSYAVVKLIIQQRGTRSLDNKNSARNTAATCFNKYRRLLVHVNLLLLMGPPSASPAIVYYLYGPVQETGVIYDATKLLRAVSILVFVLLKPRIHTLLLQKIKSYYLVFAQKDTQSSDNKCEEGQEESKL